MALKRFFFWFWALAIAAGVCSDDLCMFVLLCGCGGLGMAALLRGMTADEIKEVSGARWLEDHTPLRFGEDD